MLWIVVALEVKYLEQGSIYSKDVLKLHAYITCKAILVTRILPNLLSLIIDWALYLGSS